MLMRLIVAGLRLRVSNGASARGSTSAPSSTTPLAPNSGDPAGVCPRSIGPSVVSTFVAFLGPVQGHAQQVHLAEHFLGAAQHGATTLAFRDHQQQRIELRRERQYV